MSGSLYENMRKMMDEILRVRYSDLKREGELCLALLEMAEREKYGYGIAFAYTYLGDYYVGCDNNAQAALLLQRAKDLCLADDYRDLLPRVYNLLGIFYGAISDEQSALNCYLEALDLPELNANPAMKCAIFNNIAYTFATYGDFEEAKRYYLRCQEVAEREMGADTDSYYVLIRLWINLSEVCCALGELDECRRCLERGRAVPPYDSFSSEYLLCRGWCHYCAATNDREGVERCARFLLDSPFPDSMERYFLYETLVPVCEKNINLGNRQYAWGLLQRIQELDVENESGRMKRIHHLKVRFFETFCGPEERYEAYREFYGAMQRAEEMSDQMRSSGMKATLKLRQALKDKESAVREKDALETQAHLDELTRLYNRRYFNKLTSKALADRDLRGIGLIMVDVDYFKEYNDTYGHGAGDVALKRVAVLLNSRAGERIYPARYGGDEFVCLCLDVTDRELEGYIESVRGGLVALDIPHAASHCACQLTLTMGYVNGLRPGGLRPDVLLDAADQALYRAKEAGRNCWSKQM